MNKNLESAFSRIDICFSHFVLFIVVLCQFSDISYAEESKYQVPESVQKMRDKSDRDVVMDKMTGDDGAERQARECIAFSQQQIADQKAIAKEVGYIDRNAMYQAGLNLVSCKRQLAKLKNEKTK